MNTFELIAQSDYSGECGNIAIYHALNSQGIKVSLKQVRDTTGVGPFLTSIFGMDDELLVKGVKHFPITGIEICEEETWAVLLHQLKKHLHKGYSCIISVLDGEHWAVVSSHKGNTYTVLDSLYDEVELNYGVRDLKDWADPGETFYFIAIKK